MERAIPESFSHTYYDVNMMACDIAVELNRREADAYLKKTKQQDNNIVIIPDEYSE